MGPTNSKAGAGLRRFVEGLAHRIRVFTGCSLAFTLKLAAVLFCAVGCAVFDFSDTWRLVTKSTRVASSRLASAVSRPLSSGRPHLP